MAESQGRRKNIILEAHNLGYEQAQAGRPYDPPIWIRQNELYRQAYLRGFNTANATRLSILPR